MRRTPCGSDAEGEHDQPSVPLRWCRVCSPSSRRTNPHPSARAEGCRAAASDGREVCASPSPRSRRCPLRPLQIGGSNLPMQGLQPLRGCCGSRCSSCSTSPDVNSLRSAPRLWFARAPEKRSTPEQHLYRGCASWLRRQPLGDLHLGSPGVGDERDAHVCDEIARGYSLSDGDALGFHPFKKVRQALHLEADMIQ